MDRLMRICFVVQRFGAEIAGGAEAGCRGFALDLAGRGHSVTVATSCAVSYTTWANDYAPGSSLDGDVHVHRLPVVHGRQQERFAALSERVLNGRYVGTWDLEQEWLATQGPDIDIAGWLRAHQQFDVFVFFTYLYWPTVAGVPVVAGRVPVIVHPTAHDEPPLRLRAIRPALQMADGLIFLTIEEEAIVRSRIGLHQRGAVIGIPVDEPTPIAPSELNTLRQRLNSDHWLLCLGRNDPSKGTHELVQWYRRYRDTHENIQPLVLAGDPAHPIDPGDGVIVLGLVDERTKGALLAGATALMQPSYFESFSIVLTEAWARAVPAVVQGRGAVLAGQVARSAGGLSYRGFAEFEAAVDLVLSNDLLRTRMGASGQRFVRAEYDRSSVLHRYEEFLDTVVDEFEPVRSPVAPSD